MWDAWAGRVRERGVAEAMTVRETELVSGRDKLVRATPLGGFLCDQGSHLAWRGVLMGKGSEILRMSAPLPVG
jgi:hypothetical protein